MDPEVKVSVLMPVYVQTATQLGHLEESIDSVLSQTYPNFELIVVDDGSCDDAVRVLGSYGQQSDKVRVHRNATNKGIVYSLNKAIDLATGSLLARHDADDICVPDRLKKQAEYFQGHANCVALFTGSTDIDEFGNLLNEFPVNTDPLTLEAELLFNSRLRHPSLMVKREAIVAIGGYKEHYLAEDYDLFVRLAMYGEIHGLNESLLLYRRYGNNVDRAKRRKQMQSAAQISFHYVNELMLKNGQNPLPEEPFMRFWFLIQSRGKEPCGIVDLIRLRALWRMIAENPLLNVVWRKEILNSVKRGYSTHRKVSVIPLFLYLNWKL